MARTSGKGERRGEEGGKGAIGEGGWGLRKRRRRKEGDKQREDVEEEEDEMWG